MSISDVRTSVAAIVANYNGGPYLQTCVRSLSGQTHTLARIIIIDNGSTDGSLVTIEREPNCEIVRLDQNTGFAAASNRAATLAESCEWMLTLNPDAVLEPDWLKRMLQAAGEYPDGVMFASRLLQHDAPDLLDGAGDVFHVSGAHWRRGHGLIAQGRFTMPEEVFSPCGAAALYRREKFLEAGGFDETFFCYGEDVDLGFRLRMMGHRCIYVPDATAHHVGSASTSRGSDFAVYHGHRNLVWLYFKNMPALLFLLYLPQHLIWNLASIVWFALRGQGRVIIQAKWDAIKGLPRIFRERRKVQVRRKVSLKELSAAMHHGILREYLWRDR